MTLPDRDIFGQIDALLGKRSPAVLTEKNVQGDDFPMLTEIIKTDVFDGQPNSVKNLYTSNGVEKLQAERRVGERRQNSRSDPTMMLSNALYDSVLTALESKLMDLLQIQHDSLERSIRMIIQEELNRNK